MKFGAALGLIFTMSVIVIGLRPPKASLTFWDAVFMVIWALLLAYCLTPNRDPDSHESAGERLAFRMGKALNNVLHLGRRNPTVRD